MGKRNVKLHLFCSLPQSWEGEGWWGGGGVRVLVEKEGKLRGGGERPGQTGSRGVSQFHLVTSRTLGHPGPGNEILTASQSVLFSKQPATILPWWTSEGGSTKGLKQGNNLHGFSSELALLLLHPVVSSKNILVTFRWSQVYLFPREPAGTGLTLGLMSAKLVNPEPPSYHITDIVSREWPRGGWHLERGGSQTPWLDRALGVGRKGGGETYVVDGHQPERRMGWKDSPEWPSSFLY